MGVAIFGVPVLMILSALTVTNEYRSGMIRTTFMTVPNRSLVLVAKAIVAAVFSGSFCRGDGHGVDRGGAFRPPRLAAGGGDRAVRGARGGSGRRRRCAAAGLGRRGGAALAVAAWSPSRCWETCPTSVRRSGPYLPFANAFTFMGVQWLYPYYAMPWGELGSIVYFAARDGGRVRRGAGRPSTGVTHDPTARHRLTCRQWVGKSRAVAAVLATVGVAGRARWLWRQAREGGHQPARHRLLPPPRRPNTRRSCAGRSRATR